MHVSQTAVRRRDWLQPRLRIGFRITLGATVVLAAGVGVRALWLNDGRAEHSRQQAELLAAYNRARADVGRMAFPASIVRLPLSSCNGADACGRSALTPAQLIPRLRQMTGGGQLERMGAPPGCYLRSPLCPPTVVGRFHGFRIVAIAFWHLLGVEHGRAPRGAVRLPSTLGHSHLLFLGSDVRVSASEPAGLRGS